MPWARAATIEPAGEGEIPERTVAGIAPAELEGHAAEDQRQQHGDDRRVKRRTG